MGIIINIYCPTIKNLNNILILFYCYHIRSIKAGVDLDMGIQSYNYVSGYKYYIKENGGKHTSELAEQFSKD
ncbi:lysozyme family protein [Carnobacterium antarcticum]|uniref:Lysozyme family protein n=1 Tax=Carnobacterium antarcticum TaxID=2126436 RepID=A0ABW4NJ45_9LACT